ncbi:MAG: LarC family nickel insertion protein [Desulfovibrionaceae bacterium]
MLVYLDCRNGISGDMTLAALVDMGLALEPLALLLHGAGINCQLQTWPEQRAAGPGRRVEVNWEAPQPLRHPHDIAAIFARVEVSAAVRGKAMRVLDALTEAEAHAHGISPGQVHFHEVGAIDTLVDILGVAWGLEQLAITRVVTSALPLFSGWIDCAHGRLPLPAPATAYLLQGKILFSTEATTELITPTGAALVHGLAECGGAWPAGRVKAMGTGYGSRPVPYGLRAWLMEDGEERAQEGEKTPLGEKLGAACGGQPEEVLQLETHMDHLTGEELGAAIACLADMEKVLDVLWLAGITKKNRAGGLLRVLCMPQHGPEVCAAVVRHTHSLGIRWQQLGRVVLPRKSVAQGGSAVKAYVVDGQAYTRPECTAMRRAAAKAGVGLPAMRLGGGENKS